MQEPAEAEKPAPMEKPAGRAGGVYIPPFKLAQMLREAQDESSAQYQRLRWDALRKSLNGLINKVNKENIKAVLPEIFGEVCRRLVTGCAVLCFIVQTGNTLCTHDDVQPLHPHNKAGCQTPIEGLWAYNTAASQKCSFVST